MLALLNYCENHILLQKALKRKIL